MKRQEHKQRFYLWDYLWWQRERLQQSRPHGRVNGSFLLYGYINGTIHSALDVLVFLAFPWLVFP